MPTRSPIEVLSIWSVDTVLSPVLGQSNVGIMIIHFHACQSAHNRRLRGTGKPVQRIRLGIPAELWVNQMVDLDEVSPIAFD